MKRPSNSRTASLLLRKISRHIMGSEAAILVKSRKPPAENFITSSVFSSGPLDDFLLRRSEIKAEVSEIIASLKKK